MKKLFIALTSVFAVGVLTNSYANNQYPQVTLDQNCREQGVTYSTKENKGVTDNIKYSTTVNVPEGNTSNVNVQVRERSGESRGYDTRGNNVGKGSNNSNGNKYNSYEYNSASDAKVDINCYK